MYTSAYTRYRPIIKFRIRNREGKKKTVWEHLHLIQRLETVQRRGVRSVPSCGGGPGACCRGARVPAATQQLPRPLVKSDVGARRLPHSNPITFTDFTLKPYFGRRVLSCLRCNGKNETSACTVLEKDLFRKKSDAAISPGCVISHVEGGDANR